ncbi:MAG: hypothetical protein NVS9B4_03300 [Candidatus Acidiferrum sp.]
MARAGSYARSISLLLTASFVAAGWVHAQENPPANTPAGAPSAEQQKDDAAGFEEFSERVQKFVSLHKAVESKLPKFKTSEVPEMIAAHQAALARKIREAREHAHRGDIFTRKAREAFIHALQNAFQGPTAPHAQATVRQGDPLKAVHLRVNHVYPNGVPYTTVPPTLLQILPKLPDQVAYRIASNDFILLDVPANLIVDLIPEAVPAASQKGN